MAGNRPQAILHSLRKTFVTTKWITSTRDPFETLIAAIISQNTTGRNASRAFENLSKHFEIVPKALAKAQTRWIEQCLSATGLQKRKAETIKRVSTIIINKHHGDLAQVLSLPLEKARDALVEMPGVGPKTADIVLLFSFSRPTIPVDTHVDRVSRRLHLAPVRGGYEAVRQSLQKLYDPEDFLAVHVLLISHGRTYCKARDPLCTQCPVSDNCPSKQSRDNDD